jgi:outer membrane protein TolC
MKNKMHTLILSVILFSFSLRAVYGADVVFRSPGEAVDFAVQNSKSWILQKQGALLNMKAAKFSFQDFLPSFSFSLSESDTTSMLAPDSRTKTIQASINQELFDGGKKKLAYDVGRISSLYTYQEYESALREFSSGIISRYYQYLSQSALTIIREDMVNTAAKQLAIIRREADLGLTLETDYLEYLISYIGIENERNQSIRDLNTLERTFKAAIDLNGEAAFSIQDDFYHKFDYFYFEDFVDFLWGLVKNGSTEIKKQNLAVEYAQKQLKYSRRWYLPVIGAQGSISFSGDSFPLTEPKYAFKLTFSFSDLSLFPLSVNSGGGFDRDRLYNVNNSGSVTAKPNPAYGVQRKQADLGLMQNNLQRIQTEKDLWEFLYELIISHDNCLRSADAAERTIVVLEKRLEFSKLELDKGEKKRIEYLEELVTLAEAKISLVEYRSQAAALERSLEILAGFPFGTSSEATSGGLKDVCLQNNN